MGRSERTSGKNLSRIIHFLHRRFSPRTAVALALASAKIFSWQRRARRLLHSTFAMRGECSGNTRSTLLRRDSTQGDVKFSLSPGPYGHMTMPENIWTRSFVTFHPRGWERAPIPYRKRCCGRRFCAVLSHWHRMDLIHENPHPAPLGACEQFPAGT